ncbi:MAG: hypothetical protein R3F40_06050 [Candidatus Competibacteraceae bacterium]
MAIDLEGLPEETEIRFFGSKNSGDLRTFTARSIRPAGGGKLADTESAQVLFWSPVIEGKPPGWRFTCQLG